MLSELDIETIPREHKKEGQGWSVLWNPKSKKQLDINPVHTLVHERWVTRRYQVWLVSLISGSLCSVVCCVKFSNDGLLLATGCNRTAQIFDTKTGNKTW